MSGKVYWLADTESPAIRACSFQEFRALSEGLPIDDEVLLTAFIAGENFQGLFEVESVS